MPHTFKLEISSERIYILVGGDRQENQVQHTACQMVINIMKKSKARKREVRFKIRVKKSLIEKVTLRKDLREDREGTM